MPPPEAENRSPLPRTGQYEHVARMAWPRLTASHLRHANTLATPAMSPFSRDHVLAPDPLLLPASSGKRIRRRPFHSSHAGKRPNRSEDEDRQKVKCCIACGDTETCRRNMQYHVLALLPTGTEWPESPFSDPSLSRPLPLPNEYHFPITPPIPGSRRGSRQFLRPCQSCAQSFRISIP